MRVALDVLDEYLVSRAAVPDVRINWEGAPGIARHGIAGGVLLGSLSTNLGQILRHLGVTSGSEG